MDGERDPSAVLHDGPRARITETAGGAELRPPLGHTAAGEVDLGQRADELYTLTSGTSPSAGTRAASSFLRVCASVR